MDFGFDKHFDRNKLLRWILQHRTRVSNKLSILGNDLAIRGRRHDNSYSDSTESDLFILAMSDPIPEKRKRHREALEGLHARFNDYLPGYFQNGLSEMNFVQIMELICDRMARYEEKVTSDGDTIVNFEPSKYYDFVLEGFPEDTPETIQSMVKNTIDYIVDKNAVIKNMIKKREMLSRGEATEG